VWRRRARRGAKNHWPVGESAVSDAFFGTIA